jgi:hypothetical protein
MNFSKLSIELDVLGSDRSSPTVSPSREGGSLGTSVISGKSQGGIGSESEVCGGD